MDPTKFIDYFELLQVSPNADADTIQRVFRHLAKKYHPDHTRRRTKRSSGGWSRRIRF